MEKQYLNFEDLISLAKQDSLSSIHDQEVFVQVEADFTIDAEQDKYKEELIPFRCKAYHDMDNRNGSRIEPDVFIDNTKSIEGRPVLANIVINEDGEPDFGAHDYHLEEDEEGNLKHVYDEKPIGVVTNYGFYQDDEQQVNRAMVCGYLFERYAQEAVDILKRRKRCDCSVELAIRDAHYDIDSARMILDDYYVSGVTILGADHRPGMAGSEISLEDFSKENNSVIFNTYKHLSAEESARIQEDWMRAFFISSQQGEKGGKKVEEMNETVVAEEQNVDETTEIVETHEMTLEDQMTKVRAALEERMSNASEWCWNVAIYEDFVAYQKASDMNWYRSSYTVQDESIALEELEQAVKVFYLTDEEIAGHSEELNSVKEENEACKKKIRELEEQLSAYQTDEANRAKDAILADPVFESCLESEEFKEVVARRDELSVEDFQTQTMLAFATVQKRVLASETVQETVSSKPETSMKAFSALNNKEEKVSRYGDMFNRKN